MIATLNGEVTDKQDQFVIVECSGVGYGVNVSSETHGSLSSGQKTKLFIYEHIREESHDLYGFHSVLEKNFFEKLIGVNGVGPKMALSIMNLGSSDDISSAIASENVAYLMRASGVGRRLAERLVLELKDKFSEAALLKKVSDKSGGEALQALVSLGYSQVQAVEALADIEAKDVETKVKEALKILARG